MYSGLFGYGRGKGSTRAQIDGHQSSKLPIQFEKVYANLVRKPGARIWPKVWVFSSVASRDGSVQYARGRLPSAGRSVGGSSAKYRSSKWKVKNACLRYQQLWLPMHHLAFNFFLLYTPNAIAHVESSFRMLKGYLIFLAFNPRHFSLSPSNVFTSLPRLIHLVSLPTYPFFFCSLSLFL